jgi:hypothetical protein
VVIYSLSSIPTTAVSWDAGEKPFAPRVEVCQKGQGAVRGKEWVGTGRKEK